MSNITINSVIKLGFKLVDEHSHTGILYRKGKLEVYFNNNKSFDEVRIDTLEYENGCCNIAALIRCDTLECLKMLVDSDLI